MHRGTSGQSRKEFTRTVGYIRQETSGQSVKGFTRKFGHVARGKSTSGGRSAGEPEKAPLYLHRKSCWLFGRDRKVVDVPTDHPSCSKQHAVLQYR